MSDVEALFAKAKVCVSPTTSGRPRFQTKHLQALARGVDSLTRLHAKCMRVCICVSRGVCMQCNVHGCACASACIHACLFPSSRSWAQGLHLRAHLSIDKASPHPHAHTHVGTGAHTHVGTGTHTHVGTGTHTHGPSIQVPVVTTEKGSLGYHIPLNTSTTHRSCQFEANGRCRQFLRMCLSCYVDVRVRVRVLFRVTHIMGAC